MVLSASDTTSMRLAVKFATYKTPRASSSAMSAAWPPIDTAFPNVPAHAMQANGAATTIFHQLLFVSINVLHNIAIDKQPRYHSSHRFSRRRPPSNGVPAKRRPKTILEVRRGGEARRLTSKEKPAQKKRIPNHPARLISAVPLAPCPGTPFSRLHELLRVLF